jgi:putative FmdB family regulatory protein
MPIYEYQCDACGFEFEAMQRIGEGLLRDCPSCNQTALRKLVSAVAFRLKGTGWYETDFKNKGKPKGEDKAAGDEKSASPAATGGDSPGSAKSETPAAASAPDSAATG